MTRQRLANRRAGITDSVRWPLDGGRKVFVTAGFTADGRILETFLRGGGRVGSEIDFLLDDIAVILSRSLQHGDNLAALGRGVGRLATGAPSSVIGAVLDRLIEIESDFADARQAEIDLHRFADDGAQDRRQEVRHDG
jgi:hypothetical protein